MVWFWSRLKSSAVKDKTWSYILSTTENFSLFRSRNLCGFFLYVVRHNWLPPPQLPWQQVLPIIATAGKRTKSASLLPQCRSLGSVSGWPAQWKTLLAFMCAVNTHWRTPLVMTVPPTGELFTHEGGKTRAWAALPHKVKVKMAITLFPWKNQTWSNCWCRGHIPCGWAKSFPYGT